MCDAVALSVLSLDCPVAGDRLELERLGVRVMPDDLGRPAISRDAARLLLEELHLEQERKAQHLKEVERRAVEADQAFRAALPPGIRADQVPEGLSAAMLMCAADPMGQESRRESMVQHSLRGGGIVFHPISGDES